MAVGEGQSRLSSIAVVDQRGAAKWTTAGSRVSGCSTPLASLCPLRAANHAFDQVQYSI